MMMMMIRVASPWGIGGSGPPTNVQTPLEISTNPLKKSFCIIVYCEFLMLTNKEKMSGPPLFEL